MGVSAQKFIHMEPLRSTLTSGYGLLAPGLVSHPRPPHQDDLLIGIRKPFWSFFFISYFHFIPSLGEKVMRHSS
jgi:hypothetical protein